MKERFGTTALNQCMSGLCDAVLGNFCPQNFCHCNIWLHKNDQPCFFSMLGALWSFFVAHGADKGADYK